jgi:hypothetical protein
VLNDHAYLALRGEFVRTHLGGAAWSVNNNMGEGTVMLGLPIGKNFELRPEFRGDFSGDEIFASIRHRRKRTSSRARWPRSRSSKIQSPVESNPPALPKAARVFFFLRASAGYVVRRSRSLSTPAAVTAGPAPGPVITSGFLR